MKKILILAAILGLGVATIHADDTMTAAAMTSPTASAMPMKKKHHHHHKAKKAMMATPTAVPAATSGTAN